MSARDSRVALYTQDDLKLGAKLLLSLGARFDHYAELGARLNPRLALIVSPDAATTVKLLYGRAFRAPNEYEELYYTPGGSNLGAETNGTLEVAVERALGPNVRLVSSLFKSAIRHLIVLDAHADGTLFFRNASKLDSIGGELAVELKMRAGLAGRLSYSLQRTRNESGELPTNSPRHMVKTNFSVPLGGRRLWASADAQYLSRRLTPAGTTTQGFVLANLALLATHLPARFECSGGVYNLFDTRYSDPASDEHVQAAILQDGRSFRLQLSRRF